MALFNYAIKEITLKIVYYGPGLSGKTTNIQHLHSALNADNKGKLLSLSTESDRTLFFDFLPIELGKIRDFSIRFQLYTVPGQVRYNATRKVVLKGADAIVFVADSQRDMKYQNVESFENMRENLVANNLNPDQIPLVLQYNKRDLKNILSVDELNEDLNPDGLCPIVEAEAVKGKGVEDSFQLITRIVLKEISRKHKIEIQPAAAKPEAKAEVKSEVKIPEPQPSRKEPFSPSIKSADAAFKEALKGLADIDLKRKKELTGFSSTPEKKVPELKKESVQSHSEDSAVKPGDYEFDEALDLLTGENLDLDKEDDEIFSYKPPETVKFSSDSEPDLPTETGSADYHSEADLLESTAYDIAADLPADELFEINQTDRKPFANSKPALDQEFGVEISLETEEVQSDPEVELIESTVYDSDLSLELKDYQAFDFQDKIEEINTDSEPDADMSSPEKAIAAEENIDSHPASSSTEIRGSQSVLLSDERFRMISADILALNSRLSEISGAVSLLVKEMQTIKESLSALSDKAVSHENLEEIKKEQKEISSGFQNIASLFNELKARKSWFRF